ncbi:MAG: hypothetical protein D6722_02165 [Bacteroidetes bacterium]|nr:MAG: hypothetical protein D6722_02165 [Bacteroidota bacterium]
MVPHPGFPSFRQPVSDVVPTEFPLTQDDVAIDPALQPAPALALIQDQYPQASVIYAEREEDDDEPYA